jgi:hypothetical protein
MIDLTSYDDDYKNAEEDTQYRDVPPGTYQAFVERAWIDDPNEFSDHPRFKLQLRIINSAYEGNCLFPSAGFDYPQIVKSMVSRLDLPTPPTTASEVQDSLPDMLDRVVEVKVAENPKNPKYPRIYLQRFVRMLDEPGDRGQDDDPGADDSDIPF